MRYFFKSSADLALAHSKQPTSWDQLPTELWTHVCSYMDKYTRQNFRLVGKKYADIGGELLLETLQWSLDPASLLYLCRVGLHPTISKGIRSLHFDCTTLNRDLWTIKAFTAQEASELEVAEQHLNKDRLSNAFARFSQMLTVQQAVLDLSGELLSFTFATLRLANVRHISISSESSAGMLSYRFPQAALDPLSGCNALNAFIAGVCRNTLMPSRLELSLPWILVDSMNLGRFSELASQLVDVRISFGDSTQFSAPQVKTLKALKALLDSMPNLEALQVCFTADQCEQEPPEGVYDLEDVLPLRHHWPKIRSLALAGMRSQDRSLLDFLRAHKTVTSLLLSHIKLSSGSWIEALTKIRATLLLERVTVAGVLQLDNARCVIPDGSRLQKLLQTWMTSRSSETGSQTCPLQIAKAVCETEVMPRLNMCFNVLL